MENSKHTQGKWVVEQDSTHNQIGDRVIIRAQIPSKNLWEKIVEFQPMMSGLLGGTPRGNAERICKCVNMHDELVELLQFCQPYLNRADENGYCLAPDSVFRERIRRILKQAGVDK